MSVIQRLGIVSARLSLMAASMLVSQITCHTAVAFEEHERSKDGTVYVMNNEATGNTIAILHREEDGTITHVKNVPTGGLGSGPGPLPPFIPLPPGTPAPDGIDSQDSLVMTEDGRFLVAVNAGSGDVSVLAVTDDGLRFVDKASSGGVFPVSVAHYRNLIYVLNSGGAPNLTNIFGTPSIKGFFLDFTGKLHEIPNSTLVTGPVSSHPADALFSPDGRFLIVIEENNQAIDVFHVGEDGRLRDRMSFPGNANEPIGATFGHNRILAVTEAVAVAPKVPLLNGSSTSSYRLTEDGTLIPVSKAVPTHQSAACWIRITPDGRYAYTGNTGSGSVSTYLVSPDGVLTLLASIGANLGALSVPIDLDITPDGKFLYAMAPGLGAPNTVQGFRIEKDGTLTPINTVSDFPISMQGIVAR